MLGLRYTGVVLCALFLGGCPTLKTTSSIAWADTPKAVLLADVAYSFEVVGKGRTRGVNLPRDRRIFEGVTAEDLRIFRYVANGLEPMTFSISNAKLMGGFRPGELYLVHVAFHPWVLNKYDLFCRFRGLSRQIGGFDPGVIDPICLVILCPGGPYLADKLIDDFPLFERFKDVFPREELAGMELGPLPDELGSARGPVGLGFGDLCDQCFERNWGDLIIPGCVGFQPPPLPRWVPRGAAPNTMGQVENITNGEVVGAVNAVAPHPSDSTVLYVGSANGGIWKTENAMASAPSWTQQTDGFESLSIGALEFDPSDASNETLVAGIGRFSSLLRRGGPRTGILRTTNGGSTWTPIDGGGELRGLNISGVAPRGVTIVISANAADSLADRGVWRSMDTGVTWEQISGAIGTGLPAGPSFDLASDPSNVSRLYTNAGGAGLYRSDDTGATWTQVSNVQMNGLMAVAGNVEVACGTSGNVFVAIVGGGRLSGLFRSGNGATGWTSLDLPTTVESGGSTYGIHPGGQGNIHLSIAADAANANIVFIGGDRQPCFTESVGCNSPTTPAWPNFIGARDFSGRLFRVDASQPSGSQATPLTHVNTSSSSSPHADSRDMDIASNGVLIEGDDGGVYRRTVPLGSTGDWFSMNGDLQTTEFHNVAWDARSNVIMGGAQDTGVPEQRSRLDFTWRSVSTADGGDVAVDDTSSTVVSTRYSSNQFLFNFRRQVFDSTNTFQSQVLLNPLTVLGGGPNVIPQFYTPIELNNVDATRLAIGASNGVYESLDQGTTVTRISGIRANDGFGADPIAYGATGNVAILYVGSGANVFVRTAAAPAALTASPAYPGGAVLDLAIDPGDPNTVFAIDATDVHWTSDAGATWTTITGNLSTLSPGTLRSLVFRPGPVGAAVVGTDTVVFDASGPTYTNWSQLATGLPGAPVYDLDYDATDRIFVAGTLGRGSWVLEE